MPAVRAVGTAAVGAGGGGRRGSGVGAGDQSPRSEVAPPEVIGRKIGRKIDCP